MSAGDFGANQVSSLQPGENYLDHWFWMAENPAWVNLEPGTAQANTYYNAARANARNLARLDSSLNETIQDCNYNLLAGDDTQAGTHQKLDESYYLDAQDWYERLGSFNSLQGAERVALNTIDILGGLATRSTVDPLAKEEMDIFSATLYHELAVASQPHEPQFEQFAREALSKYTDALYSLNTGRAKVDDWIKYRGDPAVTPERTRTVMQATARMHDLEFEMQRRRIYVALGGDLQVQARPVYDQRLQADARALHSLALNDLSKFLAVNRRDTQTGEWLLPNSFVYEWYVVAQIRTQQIVDRVGRAMLDSLGMKQVRLAFPREDKPKDRMVQSKLPRLSFDMMTSSYDKQGRVSGEPLPVQIKAQSRRHFDSTNKRYSERIYVLDRSDGDLPSDPRNNKTREHMARNIAGLQKELEVTPGDRRRLMRLRERSHMFFQFSV